MKNTYTIRGDVTEIHLNHKGGRSIALIDTADLEVVAALPGRWNALIDGHTGSLYVRGKLAGKTVLLHRWIMPDIVGLHIDHINRDGLDNRRSNLRPATNHLNQLNRRVQRNNTSGVTGVTWSRSDGRWLARIKIHGQVRHLGSYLDFNDAVAAREQSQAQALAEAIADSERAA